MTTINIQLHFFSFHHHLNGSFSTIGTVFDLSCQWINISRILGGFQFSQYPIHQNKWIRVLDYHGSSLIFVLISSKKSPIKISPRWNMLYFVVSFHDMTAVFKSIMQVLGLLPNVTNIAIKQDRTSKTYLIPVTLGNRLTRSSKVSASFLLGISDTFLKQASISSVVWASIRKDK